MTVSPAIGRKSSSFGKRKPPLKPDGTYGTSYHNGTDIAPTGPDSDPVVSPEAGTVTAVSATSARGKYVIINHGRYRTLHQHLASTAVVVGQRVSEGQQIGVMGSTGGVAKHLHTEVHDGTVPIDPEPWYVSRGVKLGTKKQAPVEVMGDKAVNEREDMQGYAIRNYDGSIGLVQPDGTLDPLNLNEWNALSRSGYVSGYKQENDGTVWNELTKRTGRIRVVDAPVNTDEVAAKIGALLVPVVIDALRDVASLTPQEVEAAAERAIADVLRQGIGN